MSTNCKGPCLLHCYYKNSIILLLIGFIIGISFKQIFKFNFNKRNNKKLILSDVN